MGVPGGGLTATPRSPPAARAASAVPELCPRWRSPGPGRSQGAGGAQAWLWPGSQAGRYPDRVPLPGRVLPAMWAGRPALGLPHGAPLASWHLAGKVRRPGRCPGARADGPSVPGRAWSLRGLSTRSPGTAWARPGSPRRKQSGGGGVCRELRGPPRPRTRRARPCTRTLHPIMPAQREGRWAQTRAAPGPQLSCPGARRAEAAWRPGRTGGAAGWGPLPTRPAFHRGTPPRRRSQGDRKRRAPDAKQPGGRPPPLPAPSLPPAASGCHFETSGLCP